MLQLYEFRVLERVGKKKNGAKANLKETMAGKEKRKEWGKEREKEERKARKKVSERMEEGIEGRERKKNINRKILNSLFFQKNNS